jgi:L-alanine-DL-glutamate epimerase-like enolase superfamily enzyme
MKKREFIKMSSMIAGGTFLGSTLPGCKTGNNENISPVTGDGRLSLKFRPYTVQLRHAFTLSTSSRTSTPVMLTEIGFNGLTGYGEASMPPYLGESQETVTKFLSQVDLSPFTDPFLTEDILEYIDGIMPGNYAAKASVDIALHDLTGKLLGKPLYKIFGLNSDKTPYTSFTIGLDTAEIVKQKVAEAGPYKVLKVKLGRDNDREMIEVIRSCTDKPLCVDVNQGWKDKRYALEMANWLKEKNVLFLEQPMPKEMPDDIAWLTARSPLPVIGDEAIQNLRDMLKYKDVYSGINVKLMKCGGLRAAYNMIRTARGLGMKVMIGCMTETSCAISAAAQLAPLTDWCDLDGNLLISNDIYDGVKITDGKVILPDRPGIGVIPMPT